MRHLRGVPSVAHLYPFTSDRYQHVTPGTDDTAEVRFDSMVVGSDHQKER